MLTLATTLIDGDGAEVPTPAPLAVGFGGLELERAWNVERGRSSPEAPNIVLIVMDTQRRDRIGAYGYERPTTPRVDALAARGVTFDAAYSTASWTWPATASLLTGMSPVEHGVVGTGSCYLADELTTLAEALQQEGFTTAAWSGNPLIVPDKNFDQGFESFESGKALMRRSRVFLPGALEWLDAIEDRRFFLYLHLVDPHIPYDPHPDARELLASDVPEDFGKDTLHDLSQRLLRGEGRNAGGELDLDAVASPEARRQIDAMYDACVRTGDRWVGRVLDKLRELQLDDRTVVVFTSDHGEELFQHGHATHGQGLHAELVGVPLIIAGPGIPAGRRVTVPVSNRQIAPTLARLGGFELAGLEAPLDLFSLFDAAPTGQERVGFSTRIGWWNGTHPTTIYGLRRGPLVMHFAPEGAPWGELSPAEGGDMTLYDLERDPGEELDLSRDRPVDASAMRDELLRRIEESTSRRNGPTFGAGRSTVNMLRALGYVGEDQGDGR